MSRRGTKSSGRWSSPSRGPVNITTNGSGFNTILSVYTGTPGALTSVACNDDASAPSITTSALTNLNLTANITYYIMIAGYEGASGSLAFSLTDATLSQPVLSAPTGTIATAYGNPTYTWTDTGAATFELAVWRPTYGTNDLIFYYTNLADGTYCNGTTCSLNAVTQPSANEAARLYNGAYHGWVRNTDSGVWQGPFAFTLNAPQPAAPTMGAVSNTNTLRPTGNFTLTGAAQNIAQFWIFVNQRELHDAGNYGTPAVNRWYTRTELCGSPTSTICSFTPAVDLTDNTNYYLWALGYGPGGYATGGIGGWVNSLFRVDLIADPAVPTVNAVQINEGVPTISFSTDANTTHHSVAIFNWSAGNSLAWFVEYAKTGSKLNCTADTCTLTDDAMTLVNGQHSVFVNGRGPGGVSTGGFFGNGYGGPEQIANTGENGDFFINFGVPVVVENMSASITSGSMVGAWNTPDGTTRYNVWIGTAGALQTYYFQPHTTLALNCVAEGATCSINIPLAPLGIPSGTPLYFAVQSIGPGGARTTGGTYGNGYNVPGPFNMP